MRVPSPSVVVLAVLTACGSTAELPPGHAIGEPLAAARAVRLATIEADSSAWYERVLLVEATATAVCRKAGCWMKIEDAGRTAMVRWESGCGGRYVFPVEAEGRRVLIQGTYYPKSISEQDARHLEQEAGAGVSIPRQTHELNASAVLVLDPAR